MENISVLTEIKNDKIVFMIPLMLINHDTLSSIESLNIRLHNYKNRINNIHSDYVLYIVPDHIELYNDQDGYGFYKVFVNNSTIKNHLINIQEIDLLKTNSIEASLDISLTGNSYKKYITIANIDNIDKDGLIVFK